jgi:Lrp/AsnC family transcriptional regulator for asnA, asnC and gidA
LAHLDDTDQAIIKVLNENARAPSAQIARELNLSDRTVRNRINRLIKRKIIKPIAVVNPSAFGFLLAVDIFCELEMGSQEEAIEAISHMEEVSYLAYSTGEADISIQAIFKNSEEMHEFITLKLHRVPGIRRTRTVLVPRIVKETYEWVPPDHSFGFRQKVEAK